MEIISTYTLVATLGSFRWSNAPENTNSQYFLDNITRILGITPNNTVACQWSYSKETPFTQEEIQQLAEYLL